MRSRSSHDLNRGRSVTHWTPAATVFSPDDMEARILSCYAGGCAQRILDPACGNAGCDTDEEIAAEPLRIFGWEPRTQEFRNRAEHFVRQHWAEIVAVAEELVRTRTLDETEVELIAAAICGDTDADLSRYRRLKGGA